MLREETRSVQVGNLTIGGNNHVVIQSMCNTKTQDVGATIKQINALQQAGCELVRVAVFDKEDAYAEVVGDLYDNQIISEKTFDRITGWNNEKDKQKDDYEL